MVTQNYAIKHTLSKNKEITRLFLMLIIRSVLFLAFQALFALIFAFSNVRTAWQQSTGWWMIGVALADLVCIRLLHRLYKKEGLRFWDIFRIQKDFIKTNLLFILVFLFVAGPVGYLPNVLSARWLFGDPQIALEMLIRPLPLWAAITGLITFPSLQGLVEIPIYMLYSLPRLEQNGIRPWLAVLLSSFFLAFQHIFVPFIPDLRFITYRFVMFLPFAILIAIVMRWRPRLMPFIAVIHILMDTSIAVLPLFPSL